METDPAPDRGSHPEPPVTTTRTGTRPLLVVGGALLALYLVTLQHVHEWDGMAYAGRAIHDPLISERAPASGLFHPHHLLYVPLAILWRGLLRPFGFGQGDPFLPLQLLNTLFGAGVAVLVGSIVARRSGSTAAAIAAAAGCGLANGTWRYSTEVEVMIPALFFYVLGVRLLAAAPRRATTVGAALSLSASILLHQFTLLLVAPTLLSLFGSRSRRTALLMLASVFALVAGSYVVVAVAAVHVRSPVAFLDWVLLMRHRSTFGHLAPARASELALHALCESFLSLSPLEHWHGQGIGSALQGSQVAVDALLLVALAAVAVWSLPRVLRRLAHRDGETVALSGGIVLAVGFNLWFQPGVEDFWTYLPALMWIVAASDAEAGRRAGRWLAPLLLAMGAASLAWRALPARDPRRAPYADQLDYARDHLARGDVLILGARGALLGENLLALPMLRGVEILMAPADSSAAEVARFRAELLSRLERQRRSGGKLVAPENVLQVVRPLTTPALEWSPADSLRGQPMFASRRADSRHS